MYVSSSSILQTTHSILSGLSNLQQGKSGNEDNKYSGQITAVSTLLLCSPHTEDFGQIWEAIIDILPILPDAEVANCIYQKIVKLLEWPHSNKGKDIQISLKFHVKCLFAIVIGMSEKVWLERNG